MRLRKEPSEPKQSGFTSMIDVIFLLLLFFLLQPFKIPDAKLDAPMKKPGSDSPPPEVVPPVSVYVYVRGQQDRVSFAVDHVNLAGRSDRIAATVWEASRCTPSVPVVIKADPGVHFQHVITAFDQCQIAGMKSVCFTHPAQARTERR